MSALGRPYITNNSAGNLGNGTYCQTEIGKNELGSLSISEAAIDIICGAGITAGTYTVQKKDVNGVWFNSSVSGNLVASTTISLSWLLQPLCPNNGLRVVIANIVGGTVSEIEVNTLL